jgi:branched-chain amino acid transport system substrate-binding protein
MSGTRAALLVGCAEYEDPKFPQLPMASQDLEALARVLDDPTIGDFTVNTLLGNQSGAVKVAIEEFFADRKPDDLLLLYFSCHGVLDSGRQLHFVARETNKQLLDSTGISARWVKERMDRSRSQRIVLLLDCCYSGAFTRGFEPRAPGAKEIVEQLSGRGRMVITASGKTEFAYESKFTDAVVQGLQTGAADLDGDGQVSVCELYQYVYEQVRQNTQGQTPTMSADGMRGQLYLAKNPHAPLPLPTVIEKALTSKTIRDRLWAVEGLQYLLADDHPGGQKRTARQALLSLRDGDTDPVVRSAATKTLSKAHQPSGVADNRRWGHRLVGVSVAAVVVLTGLAVLVWGTFFPDTVAKPLACTPRTKGADGVLSLGTLFPKTGAFVYTGPPLDAGVHLAIKDINAAGGIPGITVKLDEANQRDEGNPSADTAGRSTDALLDGGVDAIIGTATSEVAVKVIDKVVCAGVIMFAPSNASPVFTMWPDHGFYFRTMAPGDVEASVLGKLVVDDGNSTVVVMSRNDVYANPTREKIVKVIQESGSRVLDSFHYDQNALDYGNYVQRVKAKNPDAIVLIGFAESGILINMIEEGLGPKSKRVYSTNVTNTLAGRVSPRNPGILAGMRGTLPDAGSEAFVRQLREANPGLQDLTYAAHSYDAVVITALAAAVAGTDEPALIAKEINGVTKTGEKCTSFVACMMLVKDRKDIDYDGPSGPLEFTDPGEPSLATYVINEIHTDGTVAPLSSERAGS